MSKILFLLQLEWLKLKNYRPFWILGGAYVFGLLMYLPFVKSIQMPRDLVSTDVLLMFPDIWRYVAWGGNWLSFMVIGFITVMSITNEFSNRTLRQSIINGLSRQDVFWAKTLLVVAMSLLATLLYVVVTLIYGFIGTETVYMNRVTEGVDWAWRYFLMNLGFSSFAMFLGFALRRSGITLFLFLVWELFLELLVRSVIHYRLFAANETMHYYPMKAFNNLIPPPFPKIMQGMMDGGKVKMYLDTNTAAMVSVVYIALFFTASYWILRKRDL